MLAELKFVQGGVAKKELIPTLTHYRIENGTVRSYNGTLALCCPIQLDIDCTPKADPFYRAIQNCKETVTMSMTSAGRLSIKSGAFKAFIDCVEEVTPHVMPEGKEVEIEGEYLLEGLKTIYPFIGNDASRPWSNGVLLKGASAYATNNVALVEYWVGTNFPITCNIPRMAIQEMIRINEAPERAMLHENSVSFLYPDGKWIRTALLNTEWPDLNKVLDSPANATPMDERIFEALDAVKPFVDKIGRVYFTDGCVKTTLIEGEGASYELPEFGIECAYSISMLALLKGVATTADFTTYPKPGLFFGDRLRGAIIGLKA